MKSLKGTKTAENLMKSFAGECQARTRYTYYASVAREEGYLQIADIFIETAEQEREHAKRFFKFLVPDFQGEQIEINAAYPVGLSEDTATNLRAAAAGEHEEWSIDYPEFARIAREEGFPQIAAAWDKISEVENRHERRYNKLLKNVEEGKVFEKDEVVFWKCLNCGYIHEGMAAPKVCPTCLYPQSYFEVWIENY